MRKKIKQLMNKEEGFTLVELLAVIVILGIIVAIAIPSIGNVINRAESNANSAEKELAADAARLYVINERIETFGGTPPNEVHNVLISGLESKGYLELEEDNDNLTGGVVITRTIVEGEDPTDEAAAYNYTYEYSDDVTATGAGS